MTNNKYKLLVVEDEENIRTLLSALLGNVLGSTVYMALSMALNVYVMVAECAFYQAYRDQPL